MTAIEANTRDEAIKYSRIRRLWIFDAAKKNRLTVFNEYRCVRSEIQSVTNSPKNIFYLGVYAIERYLNIELRISIIPKFFSFVRR